LPPHTCMTNPKEIQTDHLVHDIDRWENDGGAPRSTKSNKATSWFVPPIVVPIFLAAVIAVRIAYVAYS
jgi:hypothetical protein